MADQPPMGADIEIIEPYTRPVGSADDLPCIKPYRVRINGTDVGLIKKDSVHIDVGSADLGGEPVSVTLTLFPKSVSIRAE